MKSLSLKSLTSKNTRSPSLKLSDCFSPNATVNSILYSRCLLYIVLMISLVNLFYIIHIKNVYSLVIFFLVGFISSFFIKNMILILVFATFVSVFFQSTEYKESFEGNTEIETNDEGDDNNMDESELSHNSNNDEEEVDLTNAQMDDDSKIGKEKKPDKAAKSEKVAKMDKGVSVTKAAKLKKDMKDYFNVQEKLLDVLEKAEPLQQEAMVIKERFNENTKKE